MYVGTFIVVALLQAIHDSKTHARHGQIMHENAGAFCVGVGLSLACRANHTQN